MSLVLGPVAVYLPARASTATTVRIAPRADGLVGSAERPNMLGTAPIGTRACTAAIVRGAAICRETV